MSRRLTRAKPRKRARNGFMIKARRPSRKSTVTVKKRRSSGGGIRKVNTLSARAYFDASRWHHKPDLRVPDQISEYTPIRGVHRVDINGPTQAGGSAIYVFAWTPSACRCVWLTHQRPETGSSYYVVAFPFLATHTESSGPQLCRPLRQSVAIRNISASQDVAGVVRVLSTNHPLNWTFTYGYNGDVANVNVHETDHANVISIIGSHPQTRTITNTQLRAGVTIPLLPAALAEYKEYHEWVSLHPITNSRRYDASGNIIQVEGEMSNEHIAGKLFEEYTRKTPMSTLLIEIPTASSGFMSYDIAYHYQDAVRAKDPEGLTAQFARAARPQNSSTFAAMAHAAQNRI